MIAMRAHKRVNDSAEATMLHDALHDGNVEARHSSPTIIALGLST